MGRRELVRLVGQCGGLAGCGAGAATDAWQLGLLTTTKLDSGDRAAVRGMTRQTSKPTSSRRRQIDKS